MQNITKSILVAALAAIATPVATFAAVPTTITQNVPGLMNYQGYLANPSTGAAYVDGIYTLDIRIWNSAANKTGCLWGGKYTVYVKDGYFNLMLGDPNATALTAADGTVPTYSKGDLWKALWSSGSNDNTRYLGVTMRQDANHATISSPVEIAPRQQLLTSPFAFRAQSAQYADQAQSTFTVPGKLTVNGGAAFSGTVTLPNDSAVGPLVANSSTVKLTGNTAAASSQPNVYDVGRYLYFFSYYNMVFAPTAGNISFTVPSSYKMNVTGSGSFVSDVPVNTIGGTSTTTLGGTGATTVKGASVGVQTTGGSPSKITLDNNYLRMEGGTSIHGRGPLYWGDKGDVGGVKPIVLKTMMVTIPAGSSYMNIDLDESSYKWSVVGWTEVSGYAIPSGNRMRALMRSTISGGGSSTPILNVSLISTTSSAVKINVNLLGVYKHFVDDQR